MSSFDQQSSNGSPAKYYNRAIAPMSISTLDRLYISPRRNSTGLTASKLWIFVTASLPQIILYASQHNSRSYRISYSERESTSLRNYILLHLRRSIYISSTPHLLSWASTILVFQSTKHIALSFSSLIYGACYAFAFQFLSSLSLWFFARLLLSRSRILRRRQHYLRESLGADTFLASIAEARILANGVS